MSTSPWPGFMRRNFTAPIMAKRRACARRFGRGQPSRGRRRRPARRPAPSSRRPSRTARARGVLRARGPRSSGSSPSARRAASVLECVQPEPCAAPSGWRSPGISVSVVAVEDEVGRLVAVPAGDDRRPAGRARGARATSSSAVGVLGQPGERARLGDVGRDDGRARDELGRERVARRPRRAAARRTRRPSPGRARPACPSGSSSSTSRDRRDRRGVAEHPDLHRVDAEVARRPRGPAPGSIVGGTGCTPVTPTVFCTVIAVIAVVPCTPARANALRSAWIPAPPPESEPAIERTTGTRARRSWPPRVAHAAHRTDPVAPAGLAADEAAQLELGEADAGGSARVGRRRRRARRPCRGRRRPRRGARRGAGSSVVAVRAAQRGRAAGAVERVEDVLGVADERRAVAQQGVRARRRAAR